MPRGQPDLGRFPRGHAETQKYLRLISLNNLKKKVVNTARRVNRLTKSIEHKFSIQNYSTALVNGGVVQLLSGIAQGDTGSTRDGDKISIKSIKIRGQIKWTPIGGTPANTPSFFRLVVFRDKQQIADTAPSVADVVSGGNASSLYSLTYYQMKRFKILKDMTLTLNPPNSINVATQILQKKLFKLTIVPDVAQTIFNGANATDTQRGHFYMILIPDVVSANTQMDNDINWVIDFTDS